jgi:hypothetical protein
MIIFRSVLLRKRNVSDKGCREGQNTHFVFNNFFSEISCRLWDNVEKFGRAGQAMHFAFWIDNATDTHSWYEILTVFTRQSDYAKWASMLRLYVRTLPVLEICGISDDSTPVTTHLHSNYFMHMWHVVLARTFNSYLAGLPCICGRSLEQCIYTLASCMKQPFSKTPDSLWAG